MKRVWLAPFFVATAAGASIDKPLEVMCQCERDWRAAIVGFAVSLVVIILLPPVVKWLKENA